MDQTKKRRTDQNLADDMLSGAEEIAEYLFGDRRHRRKVYYLVECTKIPIFRLGSSLRARRSVLVDWISAQENAVRPPRSEQYEHSRQDASS